MTSRELTEWGAYLKYKEAMKDNTPNPNLDAKQRESLAQKDLERRMRGRGD